MIQLAFAAFAFVMAGMALAVLVWRDSRPRADEWQTIVRRSDQATPTDRHNRKEYECDGHP